MVAFFGEKALRTESAFAFSWIGGEFLINVSTWTNAFAVSDCEKLAAVVKREQKKTMVYFRILVNRHIHLIQ